MSERLTLPVLPLRDMVLFPGVTTPVGAGRPATLRAIEAALKTESRLIFAVAQRENVDSVSPALLYGMGTIARIGQVQRGLGGVQLVLHGEKRAAALQYAERAGHIEAVVVEAVEQPPIKPDDPAFVALFREARERAGELGEKSGLPDEVVRQVLEEVADQPGRLADLVAGYLDIPTPERQGLLDLLAVEERLRRGGGPPTRGTRGLHPPGGTQPPGAGGRGPPPPRTSLPAPWTAACTEPRAGA